MVCNMNVLEDDGDGESGPHLRIVGLCTKEPGHEGPHGDAALLTGHALHIYGYGPQEDTELPVLRIGKKLFTRSGPGLLEDQAGYIILAEVLEELIQMVGDSHSNVSRFEVKRSTAYEEELRTYRSPYLRDA